MADDFPTGRDPMRFLHGLTLTGMATLCLCCADSAPADVVEVVSGGGLRCLKTGDATVTLAGGGLSTPVAVKCRIPTEVEVPQELQLVLGSAPAPLHARVLGEGGRELK